MEEQDELPKINLRRYIPNKGSRTYLVKYVIYSIVLAILLYLIFSKLAMKI